MVFSYAEPMLWLGGESDIVGYTPNQRVEESIDDLIYIQDLESTARKKVEK